MSSLAIASPLPPLLECNDAVVGPNIDININEEDGGPLLAQPPAVVDPSNNNRRTIEEAQVACDEVIGAFSNLDMGSDDTAAAPLPPARPAIVIHEEGDEVEAVEVGALALVDGDTWPEDNNVIIRPEPEPEPERNVVVRRAVVQPALRPFRDFAGLRRRHDHPGPPLHLTLLGTKRTSERYMSRTRCFLLAPRAMPFEESDNEWGPPAFPVLDAEDSDNTSSSSTEDEE